MKRNLLGYQIDPRKTNEERVQPINYQPIFIYLHFLGYIFYLLTSDSFVCQSYYNNIPYFFYTLLLIYSFMFKFYSKACGSPGYVTDETEIEKIQDETNLDPNKFYCRYCHIYVPTRASHCISCKKCVIRRDHHCPWTNNCIGRDNHLYYLIFTFLAFVIEFIPLVDAVIHFFLFITASKFSINFLIKILIYISIICSAAFASFMTYSLTVQSILTIVRNSTTWERARRDKITYLKDLPYGYSPFNKGLAGNIVEFCTMRQKKTKWDIKPPDISLFSNELQILIENKGMIPEI